MPLRIPEREGPARITIGEAFTYLVQKTIKPESEWDTGAAVHFAGLRIFQRAQGASALPPLEGFDTDPVEIVSALCDGILTNKLTVQGMPEQLIKPWIASRWSPGQFITDWGSGQVYVEVGGRAFRFLPTLDRKEVDALFAIEGVEAQSSAAEVAPEPVASGGRVSPAALAAFVAEIMTAERLTELQARERAAQRFALRTIPDSLWRPVWRKAPNKLRPGEKPSGKSGV